MKPTGGYRTPRGVVNTLLVIILAFLPAGADAAKKGGTQGGFSVVTTRTIGSIYGGAGGDVVVSVCTVVRDKTKTSAVNISYGKASGAMTMKEAAEAVKALDAMCAAANKPAEGERLMSFDTGRGLGFGLLETGGEQVMFIRIRGLPRSIFLPTYELGTMKKILRAALVRSAG